MRTGRKKPKAGSVTRKKGHLQVRAGPDEKKGFEVAASLFWSGDVGAGATEANRTGRIGIGTVACPILAEF